MPATPPRQTHIDALKSVAAQLIVLHHFALYGPLSQGLAQAAPDFNTVLA
jgi:peptidoglycan/LPS O-acetylase OafA/YrhL